MGIKRYEDMGVMELDIVREIGSIGTGNAATALSSLLNGEIKMTIPEIDIREFNEAIASMGDPEDVIAAVLVRMNGDMQGMMMFILRLDFVNEILKSILNKQIQDYGELNEMDISALTEIGNIIISSYTNALCSLAGMDVELSVPAISVNMLGGILSVPMVEMGYETDKLMLINGKLIIRDRKHDSTILMLPDIASLNKLMEKLVGQYE